MENEAKQLIIWNRADLASFLFNCARKNFFWGLSRNITVPSYCHEGFLCRAFLGFFLCRAFFRGFSCAGPFQGVVQKYYLFWKYPPGASSKVPGSHNKVVSNVGIDKSWNLWSRAIQSNPQECLAVPQLQKQDKAWWRHQDFPLDFLQSSLFIWLLYLGTLAILFSYIFCHQWSSLKYVLKYVPLSWTILTRTNSLT